MFRQLQNIKDELLTPRDTRDMIKRRYKNYQTLLQARFTRVCASYTAAFNAPSGSYRSTIPIHDMSVLDQVYLRDGGRG